ncbi:MAG: FG-GAP-like repeat-containing protein, partial [Candidatus Sifarchaeia archaeon]
NEYVIEDTGGIHCLDIGDVDNDGQNEIWVSFLKYEGGNWISSLRYYEYEENVWNHQDVAFLESPISVVTIGDPDNDHADEVVIASFPFDGYELRYYEYSSGTWLGVNVDDSLGECHGIEIADIDHDLDNELVILAHDPAGGSQLKYFEYDSGTFTRYDILNVPDGWEIDTGDVDRDGEIEIAWANYAAPDNELRVYDYESGAWVERFVSDVPGGSVDTATAVHHVSIGDVNNDGFNELAIGIFDDGWRGLSHESVRYYEYDELTRSWNEHNVTDPDLTAEVVVIGDVDSDGDNEILVGLASWYSYSTQVPELRYYKID